MGNFFDEYKSLDRLCKDILESENGVSEYIERMEREERGKMIVADWERDYKKLKSMRYLRNRIAHEDGINENDVCSPSDTSWVMEFQDRIMAEEDPLTVLYNYDASLKKEKEKEKPKANTKAKKEADNFPDYPDINEKPKAPKPNKNAPTAEDFPDFPEPEPKPKPAPKPRKKEAPKEQPPEPEVPSFKPRFDFITALAAVLLLIGVVTAIIATCV